MKLKGVGIDKKKKKKKKPKPANEEVASEPDVTKKATRSAQHALADEDGEEDEEGVSAHHELSEDLKRDLVEYKGKTEAERRHEDRRRQRVNDESPLATTINH